MKSYIKSIIFLSCIFVGGNYVCGMEGDQKVEPRVEEGRTIIATFNITKYNIKEDVQIINDRKTDETSSRSGEIRIAIYKDMAFIDTIPNNNGLIAKKYKFDSVGLYKLYYYFDYFVTDMSYMFNGCSSLTSLDLSKFKTNLVTDMSKMFNGCSSLTSLNLSNFNTKNVIDMSSMFAECSSLTSLDLSNFNTVNVTNMSYMFAECSSLISLNISNFNTNGVKNMSGMFDGCPKELVVKHHLISKDSSQVKTIYHGPVYSGVLRRKTFSIRKLEPWKVNGSEGYKNEAIRFEHNIRENKCFLEFGMMAGWHVPGVDYSTTLEKNSQKDDILPLFCKRFCCSQGKKP